MPFRPRTFSNDISCTEFLIAYPHPAFVLHKKAAGKSAAALTPCFTNAPYRELVFGPRKESLHLAGGGLLEAISGDGKQGLDVARKLANWVEATGEAGQMPFLLDLDPPWLGGASSTVTLELTKTALNYHWVVLSLPRTALPKISSRLYPDLPPPTQSIHRAASQSFSLGPLPLPRWDALIGQKTSPFDPSPETGKAQPASLGAGGGIFTAGKQMQQMLEDYPWEMNPLGPRELWPQSLKTAVSAVMSSPHPWALWWGPDVVLIYNDAYAERVAGNKHPQLFGQCGKVAWGEVWEALGPLFDRVIQEGLSVARQDDKMFFDRLTNKMLPEEVYHSWAWIPVRAENGEVAGALNTTQESTSKKMYERRIQILRSLGDKSALARSKSEFADVTRKVITEEAYFDMPFVAFYYNAVEAPPKPILPANSEWLRSPKSTTLRVTSKLVYTIGVPDDHPAIPLKEVHHLDTVTLRPPLSLKRRPASPGSTVMGTNTTEDSLTVVSLSDTDDVDFSPSPSPDPQWPFFDIFSTRQPLHVQSLPPSITNDPKFGYRPQGYNDTPREAVIIPIAIDGDQVPAAILIIGLNTRRPYDREHRTWIDLLHVTLSSALTASLGREAEVQKAEQLAQLDAAKTSFFSSASHELRTPLTLIAGPVTDASEMTTEPKVKELLKLSTRNITRLGRLVDSLMDFSRLEAGRLVGRFQPTELADFTADLASMFRKPIERESLEYNVTIDLRDETPVYVDQELWEKIVFNIIGNAFKYTMTGHVHVHVQYRPPHAEFIVSDTGVGIPSEDLYKIFERFHRVSATARSHEGTGIGLALTRELVKIHGGHMAVHSTLEDKTNPDTPHGTTFTVFIPLGNDHLPRASIDETDQDIPSSRAYGKGIVEEATGWAKNPQPSQEDVTPSVSANSDSLWDSGSSRSGEMDALFRFEPEDTILVVDDNSDIRRFLRSIFKRYCTVIEAENAMAGLQIMQTRKPDLVLTDFMMPGMDGMQFVSAIRDQQPSLELVPVIILTARAGDEARVEGLMSGADDYVSKPFKSKELIARVHLHIQIGKRKIEMQRAFEARTNEIKVLSDLSPVGIFRTDNQGQVTYTNKRWHEVTEYPANQALSDWILNVHPDFQKAVLDLTTASLQNDEGGNLEICWLNDRWTKLQVERVSNGLIGTLTDVSDRRLYEAAQLAQAKEREVLAQVRAADAERQRAEADERRRAQELLVDVTSHELRQPVSAILNCSQLVRSNLEVLADKLKVAQSKPFVPTPALLATIEEDLDALDSIYQCALSQERIANDVLSLSRMQLDTLNIQSVEFPLIKELRRILSIFTNELKMKNITLEIKFGSSVYVFGIDKIVSDRNRFGQIVTNLMSNAIKFTDISIAPDRRITVVVDVSLDPPLPQQCTPPPASVTDIVTAKTKAKQPETTAYVYVAVLDSGPGLKPGDLALLFQRFQQGSNSHEVFGGSGLGLFVSRKLCELMGGNIDVSSVYGQGATFRFFIEVKTASSGETNTGGSATSSPGKSQAVISGPPTPKDPLTSALRARRTSGPPSQTAYHVLITEDNIINQTVLNRQLKQAGFTTELASNGKLALEAVQRLASGEGTVEPGLPRRFDAILMDCEMPVMNGHTSTREIRKLESTGVLPLRNRIIALTGNARQGQVEAAMGAGMDDVVIKPYKIDELVMKIRDWAQSD